MFISVVNTRAKRLKKRKGESMAKFSRGLEAEDRLCTMLKNFGCQLMRDETLNHRHKLDFVVLQLPEFSQLLPKPLGVQVTQNLGNEEKQEEFFRRVREFPFAKKNLYLELESGLNLETGGAFMVLAVITQFLMDSRFEDEDTAAVRIRKDFCYQFVLEKREPASLAVAVGAPRPAPVVLEPKSPGIPRPSGHPQSAFGQILQNALDGSGNTGRVVSYNRERGFGRIKEDGTDQEFFLHINNVTDLNLKERLDSVQGDVSEFNPIHIQFQDGGRSDGRKNNTALSIRPLRASK
jgi:cold shock CspA family protein